MALEVSRVVGGYASRTGTYAKVIETNVNWDKQEAHLVLGLYLNKDHSDQDPLLPLSQYSYDLNQDNFPFVKNGSVVQAAYTVIKDLAVDVYQLDDKGQVLKDEQGTPQMLSVKIWEGAKDV